MTNSEIFHDIIANRRSVRLYEENKVVDPASIKRSLQRATLSPNSSNLQLWEFYWVSDKLKQKELAKICLGQPAAVTAQELVVFVVRRDLWKKRVNFMLDILKRKFGDQESKNKKIKNKSSKTGTDKSGNVLQNVGDKDERAKAVLQYYGKLMPLLYWSDPFRLFGLTKKIAQFFSGLKKPVPREVGFTDTRIIAHKSVALAAQTFMLSMKAEGYDTCPMEGMDSKRLKKFLRLPLGAEISMVISCGVAIPDGIYGSRIRVNQDEVIFKI